ncbi:MAG: aminotransferase class I/II-fold pyridoxal phosphate-dependent enzyme, partial [Bryobacteraceae bacterium]
AGDIAGRDDIMVLSDEIYNRLIFEGRHHSIVSLPGFKDRTILLDGFSKTYAMTGWRLGYGVMRPDLAAKIARLATNCHSCTATFSQMAAIEALKGDQSAVATMREAFRKRRDYFIERVNQIKGFNCIAPHGAFYAFANITQTGWKSKDLAGALLEETGVALLSGTAFGAHGEGYVRFSIANSIQNIAKALDRIDQWTKKRL